MSPSAALAHRWPKPLAKRKGAHPPLPTVTAPIRTRKACASRCYTTSQKGPPRPQARTAPAQGLRLPGKRPPYLPRPSSARATRTPPRCLDADGRLRTPPRGEYPKAPAKTAARLQVGHVIFPFSNDFTEWVMTPEDVLPPSIRLPVSQAGSSPRA